MAQAQLYVVQGRIHGADGRYRRPRWEIREAVPGGPAIDSGTEDTTAACWAVGAARLEELQSNNPTTQQPRIVTYTRRGRADIYVTDDHTVHVDLPAERSNTTRPSAPKPRRTPERDVTLAAVNSLDLWPGDIVEVKASASRHDVAHAVGQVLLYRHEKGGPGRNIVCFPREPDAALLQYIEDHGCELAVVA